MKKTLSLLLLLCAAGILHAQYVYSIKADSVKITSACDSSELIIENHTQNVPGFLYNKGRGRTEFRRAVKLNDSTLVLGGDTIVIQGTVPTLQQVLTAGSDLTVPDNQITFGVGNSSLYFSSQGEGGTFLIGNNNSDYGLVSTTGEGFSMQYYKGEDVMSSTMIQYLNGTSYIEVLDGINQHGFHYDGDYSTVGLTDNFWIPHLGAVKKLVSDSIRNTPPSVLRTAVNNAGYTVLTTDYLVAYTSLTAARTVTLPAASDMTNRILIVKDESGAAGTYNITVNVTAGGAIDGAASKLLSINYGVIEMYSNGVQWFTK